MDDKSTKVSFQVKGAFGQVSGPTGVAGGGYIKPEVKHESPPTDDEGIYLLFAGPEYDSAGGVHDYVGAFSTIQEAMDAKTVKQEWAHIAVFRDKLFHVVMEWNEWYRDEDSGPYKGWRRGAIEP